MARLPAKPLHDAIGRWSVLRAAPGASAPDEETAIPAAVPGTVAAALRAAGRLNLMQPPDLEAHDWWFRSQVSGHGQYVLIADGIATCADIVLDGVKIA